MGDDGGLQYWQQLGLQQQFDEVFNNGINDSGKTENAIQPKADKLASWQYEQRKE